MRQNQWWTLCCYGNIIACFNRFWPHLHDTIDFKNKVFQISDGCIIQCQELVQLPLLFAMQASSCTQFAGSIWSTTRLSCRSLRSFKTFSHPSRRRWRQILRANSVGPILTGPAKKKSTISTESLPSEDSFSRLAIPVVEIDPGGM